MKSFFLLFARFTYIDCPSGTKKIYKQTKIYKNNLDSVQNEETVNISLENNPCREIFAFSASRSKEVYFLKIFSENQKSWTQGLLLSMKKIYALSRGV